MVQKIYLQVHKTCCAAQIHPQVHRETSCPRFVTYVSNLSQQSQRSSTTDGDHELHAAIGNSRCTSVMSCVIPQISNASDSTVSVTSIKLNYCMFYCWKMEISEICRFIPTTCSNLVLCNIGSETRGFRFL